jgi:hypothetical protein
MFSRAANLLGVEIFCRFPTLSKRPTRYVKEPRQSDSIRAATRASDCRSKRANARNPTCRVMVVHERVYFRLVDSHELVPCPEPFVATVLLCLAPSGTCRATELAQTGHSRVSTVCGLVLDIEPA